MVPSTLIKGQTRSKLTEKLTKVWKNVRAPYYIYMATLEEKQIDNAFENGMTNVFLRESSGD